MKKILFSIFAASLATAADKPANWPQWRGPHGDGTAPGEKAPTTWSETKKPKVEIETTRLRGIQPDRLE